MLQLQSHCQMTFSLHDNIFGGTFYADEFHDRGYIIFSDSLLCLHALLSLKLKNSNISNSMSKHSCLSLLGEYSCLLLNTKSCGTRGNERMDSVAKKVSKF